MLKIFILGVIGLISGFIFGVLLPVIIAFFVIIFSKKKNGPPPAFVQGGWALSFFLPAPFAVIGIIVAIFFFK